MARPLRIEFAGALYHITSRGDRQEEVYLDDTDRLTFLEILGDVCDRFNWHVHAYCLMSNHYHLLVETPDANLSLGMRQLNGVYTQRTNRRHHRVGHVFQGRYTAIIVQKESYLLELARYIVLNPVRARMVHSAREWPWSSYRATTGQTTRPDWLTTDWILAAFGNRKLAAMRAYWTFVSEGKNQPSPWAGLTNQIYLGDEVFVEKLQRELGPDKDLSEIPTAQRRPVPKSLPDYERQAASRDEAIRLAYASGGYSMKVIGEYFDIHYSRVSRILKNARAKRKT
ncbi:REP-associated tyrosine transposase [Sulfuriflexus sp.]|uniref:REP-associated tyrosine transposase n=1 Tax=Sulfuriflexus sp. TaxID=2015443 RepID=UPI0028CEF3DB|nr:transposase [Sulfuriflexus sp.]MDT8403638.1 transposase [Sulfuriflexus sp.]